MPSLRIMHHGLLRIQWMHYRNLALYRVSSGLPSVFLTLGKELLCRVPKEKHSTKKTLDKVDSLPSAKKTLSKILPSVFLALGKKPSLPSVFLFGKKPSSRRWKVWRSSAGGREEPKPLSTLQLHLFLKVCQHHQVCTNMCKCVSVFTTIFFEGVKLAH